MPFFFVFTARAALHPARIRFQRFSSIPPPPPLRRLFLFHSIFRVVFFFFFLIHEFRCRISRHFQLTTHVSIATVPTERPKLRRASYGLYGLRWSTYELKVIIISDYSITLVTSVSFSDSHRSVPNFNAYK